MTIELLNQGDAGYSHDIPHLPWSQFYENAFVWNQGEHVGMIGPSGQGKTNLCLLILPKRDYVTVLATKPRDKTLDLYAKALHYKKIAKWNPKMKVDKYPRRILWPDASHLRQSKDIQRNAFLDALDHIYYDGGWCVVWEELWWIAQQLGMTQEAKTFLQQGRSMDISNVMATQRPAWVPLEVYDNSTHLFFWADNDETNLRRISSIGSFNSAAIRARITTLAKHEVLYVNTRDKVMYTTRPPLLVINEGREKG